MTDKVNALLTAKPRNPRFASGTKARKQEFKAALTSANSDAGDEILLAGPFSFEDRISGIFPNGDTVPALTSATDNDLGFFFKDETGTLQPVKDADGVDVGTDVLWNGVSLATEFTGHNILLAKNAALDESLSIGGHMGLGPDLQPFGGVYLVWTMNTANTATATYRLFIEIDEATTGV